MFNLFFIWQSHLYSSQTASAPSPEAWELRCHQKRDENGENTARTVPNSQKPSETVPGTKKQPKGAHELYETFAGTKRENWPRAA